MVSCNEDDCIFLSSIEEFPMTDFINEGCLGTIYLIDGNEETGALSGCLA